MDSYNYNISPFNLNQIMDEVLLSINKKLWVSYEGEVVDGFCSTNENIITFNFYYNLTPEEQSGLNDVVNNYVYNPNYNSLKCFKINNSSENPSQIDYDILGFNKKRTIIKGELRQVEYYRNYISSSQTYSNLVVSEFRDYTRNDIGIAQSRIQTSNWILNDNTTGLTMTFEKYYTQEEGIQEGIDRRNNMIAFVKTTLLDGLKTVFGEPTNQMYAFDLLLSVKTQMDYFSQGYTQPLRDAVSASTKAYMQIPGLKEAIIEQLTF